MLLAESRLLIPIMVDLFRFDLAHCLMGSKSGKPYDHDGFTCLLASCNSKHIDSRPQSPPISSNICDGPDLLLNIKPPMHTEGTRGSDMASKQAHL